MEHWLRNWKEVEVYTGWRRAALVKHHEKHGFPLLYGPGGDVRIPTWLVDAWLLRWNANLSRDTKKRKGYYCNGKKPPKEKLGRPKGVKNKTFDKWEE